MKRFLLILMSIALIFVIGANIVWFFIPKNEPTITQPLSELLPAEIEGWTSVDVPLASTPEGSQKVLDILALDDVVCREYRSGSTEILIYAAYWKPGSQPYSSVGLHNPDSCWVNSGWKIEKRENNRKTKLAQYNLKQHEWGIYSKDHVRSHVMFWHLLGGEPNNFLKYMLWNGTGLHSITRHFYFVFNLSQMGLDLNRDQLFVRISSNIPFESLQEKENFQEMLKQLKSLNIYDTSESE